MIKSIKYFMCGTGLLIVFLSEGCQTKEVERLTIATAANLQFAMKNLKEAFTMETGIKCETIVSSSGKLTAQIKEGAPFDVLVSADMKYPNELFRAGLTTGKPQIYAYGRLVMWSMIDELNPSFRMLTDGNVNHIALANPMTAPYGAASLEALRYYHIYTDVNEKLVYGESISQTNQFITSGAAEIGFTSASVVLSKKMQGKGQWIDVDSSAYSSIAQGVVILKKRRNQSEEGKRFVEFLFSEKGKNILKTFGYTVRD